VVFNLIALVSLTQSKILYDLVGAIDHLGTLNESALSPNGLMAIGIHATAGLSPAE